MIILRKYSLQKKNFGIVGEVGGIVNTAADTAKKVAGTGMQVAGDTVSTAASIGKPVAKGYGFLKGAALGAAKYGGLLNNPVGAALGALGYGILGATAGGMAADLTKKVGDSVSDAGHDLKS